MNAIAINGSPRPGGNTEIMLKKVLEPLEAAGWETEYRQIGGKAVRGCLACFKCVEKRNGRLLVRRTRSEVKESFSSDKATLKYLSPDFLRWGKEPL